VPETLRTPTGVPGALDAKTARLIAFAALIAQGSDAARWHAVLAQRYGASLPELEHAAAIASFVGGGGRALEVAHKAIAELRASSGKT
jgi:alkylhydroperoxidase/carboxymuconolactone decarboxylase family protein YurZ